MPDKFKELLSEGGFTDKDKEAVQAEEIENVERDPKPPLRVGEAKPEASAPKLDETLTNRDTRDWNPSKSDQTNDITPNMIDRYKSQADQKQQQNELTSDGKGADEPAVGEKGNAPQVDAAKKEAQQPPKEPDTKDKGNERDLDQER